MNMKSFLRNLRVYVFRQVAELLEFKVFLEMHFFYKEKFKGNKHTVLDIGANVGQSINLFLKLNKNSQIFSFEPNSLLVFGRYLILIFVFLSIYFD